MTAARLARALFAICFVAGAANADPLVERSRLEVQPAGGKAITELES